MKKNYKRILASILASLIVAGSAASTAVFAESAEPEEEAAVTVQSDDEVVGTAENPEDTETADETAGETKETQPAAEEEAQQEQETTEETAYAVQITETGITVTRNGEKLSSVNLAVLNEGSGMTVVEPATAEAVIYTLDEEGNGTVSEGSAVLMIAFGDSETLCNVKDGAFVSAFTGIHEGKAYETGALCAAGYILIDEKLYQVEEDGSAALFTGLYEGKAYKDGVAEAAGYLEIEGVLYEVSEDGTAVLFTGVYENAYYESGIKLAAPGEGKYLYRLYEGYAYIIDDTGKAEVYIRDASRTGTFRKMISEKCYLVEINTGKASPYTGEYRNAYYKSGIKLVAPEDKYLYRLYKGYVYIIDDTGKAEVYIRDASRTGTFGKLVSGKCYQVEYQTGKASLFTGVCKDAYYESGIKLVPTKSTLRVYKGYVYKVTKVTGFTEKYIKDKTGTYKKKVSGIMYKVSYKTGKAKKFTGIYKNTYYKNGKLGSGWYKTGSDKYYFTKGEMALGWKKIGSYKYYFTKSGSNIGKMAKNKIIGSNYVGPDGILCKDKVIKKAVAFVNSTSSASASRSARLSAAFDALTRFPYVRYMESTPGRAQMATIANQMFTRRGGNCYRYGAAFAYAATVLGYSSGTSTGMISAAGGGVTPHGWANVYINGFQYICDPDMAMAMGKSGFYMTSFAYYRVKPLITYNVYKMKVSKGKVIWS